MPSAATPIIIGRAGTVAGPELVLTGERTLPGIVEENYWFRRHEAAYRAVAPFTRGALVLEAGCGEGYGAAVLARFAGRVLAVDLDAATVRHVHGRYPDDVVAVVGDVQRLPVVTGAVEVVASLQSIEHLTDQAGFLAECSRVLRPSGTLLLTTPNQLTFSPGLERPLNPFHTRELSPPELDLLLAPLFTSIRSWGLRHGPRLQRWEHRHGSLVDGLLAAAPADWSPELMSVVRSVTAADFLIDDADRVDCLDLVTVALRR